MVIRRVQPLSLAKIAGILQAVIGLLVGLMFAAVGSFVGTLAQASDGPHMPFAGMFLGVGAIVMMPIFYGIIGFVFGLIGAVIYNALAGVVGGIEIEVS